MKAIKKIAMAILWVITIVIVYFWVTEYLFPKDTTSEYVVTSEEAAREASDMMLSEVYDEFSKNPYGFAVNHTGERLCLDMYYNYSIIAETLWVDITGEFDVVICKADSEALASLDLTAPYYIIGTVQSGIGSELELIDCTFIPA